MSVKIKKYLSTMLLFMAAGILVFTGGCGSREPVATTMTSESHTGGTLNLYGTDPHTLDPALAAESTSIQYVMQIYGGLVRLDENLEPAPDIAEKWETSTDGTVYTFHLDEDATFHDGRRVTAGDVKYSWERACNPATGSPTAATYLGDIVGANDVLDGSKTEISGIEVIDSTTLRVTIDSPKSYFIAKLTYPTAYVVDRENVKAGRTWWHAPNGTGPFIMDEWTEGSRLVLARYAGYHGQTAQLDSVVFKILGGVPMNLYELGDIDATGVSVSYIDRVTDPAGPFAGQLITVPELSFYYIGFNTAKPPFDDPAVRKAFSLTVDREKLVSLIYRGMLEGASGILPPGIPGYDENLPKLEYDMAEAKRLIGSSSYGSVENLPDITLTTAGWGGVVSSAIEAIAFTWERELGVTIEIRQLEPQRFFYHMTEEADELFDMGWIADYPHPQNFLEVLFGTGSESNAGGYRNAAVDTLLEEAGAEMDTARSLELYGEAERLLIEDSACIPLWFGENYLIVKPYVKGYVPSALGVVMLNRVSIEK